MSSSMEPDVSANLKKCAAVLAMAAVGLAQSAVAAPADTDYPSRTVQVIVPAPPGGANDIIGRILTAKLTENTGKSWVADNRPGASGNIAVEAVVRAPADGYTMHIGNAVTYITNQHLFKNLSFNAMRDTVPVGMMGRIPNGIVVPASSPFQSLQELLDYSRANPGQLNYGTGGNGTSPHLFMELLKKRAGVDIVHVPYRGSAQMLTDLLAGRVDVSLENLPVILGPAKSGQVRILAVTSPEPSAALPEVPTLQSLGIPDVNVQSWFGLFVPAATPVAVQEAINTRVNEALSDPGVVSRLATVGVTPIGGNLADIRRFIEGEKALWEEAVIVSGARID